MTRFSKLLLAAALGGTALAGTAYAAQDEAAPPPAGMHHHRHGHGDRLAKLDTNNDGTITRAEAIAAADARFAKGDTNGDGQITKEERQAKHEAMRAKWQARRAAKGDHAAPNADGQKMHRQHGMRHHHGMMQRVDANTDGTVTKAETETAATTHFDAMDANHDGRLDQTEIAAIKAKMQARMADRRAKWQAKHAAAAPAQTTPTDQ